MSSQKDDPPHGGESSGAWVFSTHGFAMSGVPPEATSDERATAENHAHLEIIGPLGAGGMGEVLRVYDHRLQRHLAMKVLHRKAARQPALVDRFLAEAQATAQLTHPGIVAVHELGTLPDGRPFFTMKEVRGQTFADVLAERRLHPDRWPLRRVVDIARRVCEAVGYAHSRGVLHRDLKPSNIMVGAFGEVLVMDWGLVKVDGQVLEPIVTDRTSATRVGQISGTPAYMAPEQARGVTVDPRADVFALGTILREILTGEPAHLGDAYSVLEAVRDGVREPLPQGLPAELCEVCHAAESRRASDRPEHAGLVADQLTAWLEGAKRRERALTLVAQATAHATAQHQSQVALHVAQTDLHAARKNAEDKQALWAAEDRVQALKSQAAKDERSHVRSLRAALSHEPTLPEAIGSLAAHHRAKHADAEHREDAEQATLHLEELRDYNRGEHDAYLRGTGRLTLHTTPPGARVTLFRFERVHRRLVPVMQRDLGHTPLVHVPIEMGSYVLELRAPDRATVRYPVYIERGQDWHGRPPDAGQPQPVVLPCTHALGPDDVYVPAGWTLEGNARADVMLASRDKAWRWVPAAVVRRFQVTVKEYVAFLDDLVDNGRIDEAIRHAPRERGASLDSDVGMIFARDASGHFVLVPDADGDLWDPMWPMMNVTWHDAMAYAAWLADSTGLPWSLPHETTWDKAARGVDGRIFPWGDDFDETFALTRDSFRGAPTLYAVTTFPDDVSPYGVRGLAGGVRDWCRNPFHDDRQADDVPTDCERAVRGGCWFFHSTTSMVASRITLGQNNRGDTIGFRLCRPLVPTDAQ